MKRHARLIAGLMIAAIAIPVLLAAYHGVVWLYRIRHPLEYILLEPKFAEQIQDPLVFWNPETRQFSLPDVPLGQSFGQTLRSMDLYRELGAGQDFSEELADIYSYPDCRVEVLERLWTLSFHLSSSNHCYCITLETEQQSAEDTAALLQAFLDEFGTPQYGNYHPEDGASVLQSAESYGCLWVTESSEKPVTMLEVCQYTPENIENPPTYVEISVAAEMDAQRRTNTFYGLGSIPYESGGEES